MQNNKTPSKYIWSDEYSIFTDLKDEYKILKAGQHDESLYTYSSPALNKAIYSKLSKLVNQYSKKNCDFTVEYLGNEWVIFFFEEKSSDQYLKELRQFYKNAKAKKA